MLILNRKTFRILGQYYYSCFKLTLIKVIIAVIKYTWLEAAKARRVNFVLECEGTVCMMGKVWQWGQLQLWWQEYEAAGHTVLQGQGDEFWCFADVLLIPFCVCLAPPSMAWHCPHPGWISSVKPRWRHFHRPLERCSLVIPDPVKLKITINHRKT